MTHEYTWSSTTPLSSEKAGNGASEIQKSRKMAYERLAVDHNMGGILAEASDQDGTHKQATLKAKTATPAYLAGAGIVYAKNNVVDGVTYVDLCYLDSSGNEVFLTEKGESPIIQARLLVVSGSSSISLSSAYGNEITFETEVDRTPDELNWASDYIFTCDRGGFYYIALSCESDEAVSLAIYKNGVLYIEWDIVANEGANNRFTIMFLEDDDYITIKGKSMTISTATITTRGLQISQV